MTDDIIAKAKAVTGLWDLLLFTSGNVDARGRRADVLHQAILNLEAAITKATEAHKG